MNKQIEYIDKWIEENKKSPNWYQLVQLRTMFKNIPSDFSYQNLFRNKELVNGDVIDWNGIDVTPDKDYIFVYRKGKYTLYESPFSNSYSYEVIEKHVSEVLDVIIKKYIDIVDDFRLDEEIYLFGRLIYNHVNNILELLGVDKAGNLGDVQLFYLSSHTIQYMTNRDDFVSSINLLLKQKILVKETKSNFAVINCDSSEYPRGVGFNKELTDEMIDTNISRMNDLDIVGIYDNMLLAKVTTLKDVKRLKFIFGDMDMCFVLSEQVINSSWNGNEELSNV